MLEGTITGVSSQNWLQTRKYFKRRLTTVICFHPQLIVGETVRLHRGKSFKLGCPFYIAFTAIKDQPGWYRCRGINAEHLCMPDIYTVDRYYQYRMRDPAIQEDAIIMMQNRIRAGQVASTLQDKHKIPVRPTDVHRVMQTRRDNLKSLSDVGIQASETRRLLDEINKYNHQYCIKFKEDTQIMECILYWNPRDVELCRLFCQVSTGTWMLSPGASS